MPKIQYSHLRFRPDKIELIERANQIIDDYEKQGLFLTLRQLYYRFVAADIIPNTQQSYDNLGKLMVRARLAGLVDWDRIEDRTRSFENNSHWDSPEEMIANAAGWYARDKWEGQSNYVEVWVEKDALFGVVDQICNELDVGRFSCRGYTSSSEMWRAAMRHMQQMQNGKAHCTVLHLSDHDPSGVNMTDDIIKRFKLFCRRHGFIPPLTDRIGLTLAQVRKYNPPPNPAKQSDSRYKRYVRKFNITDCWELDALDPKVLRSLIKRHVLELRSKRLWDVAVQRQEEERALLEQARDKWAKIEKMLKR